MIPQAVIRAVAQQESLQPTTVEKDYVLGWVLYGISRHAQLSRWVFKGGTCLKKCFFETYRFSEDLDFTVPPSEALSTELIETALNMICDFPAHTNAPLGRSLASGAADRAVDQCRFAARNRLCAEVVYQGVARVVEPYSIRVAQTGNMLLYVWELRRGSSPTNQIKAYKLDELGATRVLNEPFAPRYAIEL